MKLRKQPTNSWCVLYSSMRLVHGTLQQISDIRLAAVQRRAACMICGIQRTDHKTSTAGLLQKLDIPSLAKRRQDMCLKVFRQYYHTNSQVLNNYVKPATHISARRHPHQYFLHQSNTDHHRRSFFIRTAKQWNALPPDSLFLNPPSV